MGMPERARMHAARDQAGEVRHVDHQDGADLVGDGAEAREVDDARIGRAAGDDDARLVLARQRGHRVEVDALVLAAHAVVHGLEPLAGQVGRRAVGQVPARRQRQPEDGVAGLGQRQQHRLVGLAAGARLHVGEVAVEQLLGALDGQRLGLVDVLAAAVVAPARIALGILVGERRAGGLQHRAADDVLRGDQLDLVALAVGLARHGRVDRRVGGGEPGGEERARPLQVRPLRRSPHRRPRSACESYLACCIPESRPDDQWK